MPDIATLSWSRVDFRDKLRLFFKSGNENLPKIHSCSAELAADGYSALSSTYYSIAGSAFRQISQACRSPYLTLPRLAIWTLTWLPLGLFCYVRMLPLSNRVLKLIGYERMTADQCEIRQSILRRRGKYREALRCIQYGHSKTPLSTHTMILLALAFADVHEHLSNEAGARNVFHRARSLICMHMADVEMREPQQSIRIYRHAKKLAERLGSENDAAKYDARAKQLAQTTGSRDQLLKMAHQ